MTKRKRKLISLLLAVVLIFCMTSMMASATVEETGSAASISYTDPATGVKMSASVSRTTTSGTATTKLSKTGGLTAHVSLHYVTPASPHFPVKEKKIAQNSGTSVSATVYLNSLYTTTQVYGGHDVSYNTVYFPHLETKN